jgi:predicted anti-sigma-YlaC factor YlaD
MTMNCDTIRDELATNPTTDDTTVQAHLQQCPACEAYRRSHAALDAVLRTEMRWEAPAALTASLLAIAATAPLAENESWRVAPQPRPQSWYVTLVYVLTSMAIAVSLMVAWQFVGGLLVQVGISDVWAWLWNAPSQAMQALVQTLPQARVALAFILDMRDKLLWLLLAAVLWAAFDKWNPPTHIGRQQRA